MIPFLVCASMQLSKALNTLSNFFFPALYGTSQRSKKVVSLKDDRLSYRSKKYITLLACSGRRCRITGDFFKNRSSLVFAYPV